MKKKTTKFRWRPRRGVTTAIKMAFRLSLPVRCLTPAGWIVTAGVALIPWEDAFAEAYEVEEECDESEELDLPVEPKISKEEACRLIANAVLRQAFHECLNDSSIKTEEGIRECIRNFISNSSYPPECKQVINELARDHFKTC